jgi:hypothetical protein
MKYKIDIGIIFIILYITLGFWYGVQLNNYRITIFYLNMNIFSQHLYFQKILIQYNQYCRQITSISMYYTQNKNITLIKYLNIFFIFFFTTM